MIASEHSNSERLQDLKDKVISSSQYFKKNAERYNEFMRFVFSTSLSQEDITKLQALNKPTIEFNVLEAMISRLRGEFAQQEPGIVVTASEGVGIQSITKEFLKTIDFLEAHMRHVVADSAENDALQYNIMTDLLGGGYSVVECFNDYVNELSFDQQVKVKRVFDPTLTGFDPLARESHKGDGNYCFQIFPRLRADFEREFGKEVSDSMKFSRVDEFNWSYENEKQQIVLICDLFEKRKKKVKIVKISTGHVVTKKHFEELLEEWNARGYFEQPPVIVEERWSELESIVRYRFCETKVLSYDVTDYKYLPLIFIDGNSVEIKDSANNSSCQMTRPYCYHARGIQRLKNFSGQTVAAEIENMVQHKFKVAIESIPDDYVEAYRNVQQAEVLFYNGFYKSNPEIPLPPPMEIMRTPTPEIVQSTFLGSDQVTQSILGSYDGVLGINDKDISGVAITQGAIQSSAAATPYLMGYIKGLNRILQVLLDLIPKYYVTPRTLPVLTSDGKRSYQVVNDQQDEDSIDLNFKAHELNVKVEAGVNTAIQKQVALDQIIRMMQSSPLFAQFINTDGLEVILDNMDIRGIDSLKASAATFMQQLKEEQERAQQAQQKDPLIEATEMESQVEMARIEQRSVQAEGELAIKAAQVAIEKEKVDAQIMSILNDIEMKNAKLMLDHEKVDSENARSAVESAIELSKHHQEKSNVQIDFEGAPEAV